MDLGGIYLMAPLSIKAKPKIPTTNYVQGRDSLGANSFILKGRGVTGGAWQLWRRAVVHHKDEKDSNKSKKRQRKVKHSELKM